MRPKARPERMPKKASVEGARLPAREPFKLRTGGGGGGGEEGGGEGEESAVVMFQLDVFD